MKCGQGVWREGKGQFPLARKKGGRKKPARKGPRECVPDRILLSFSNDEEVIARPEKVRRANLGGERDATSPPKERKKKIHRRRQERKRESTSVNGKRNETAVRATKKRNTKRKSYARRPQLIKKEGETSTVSF